MTSFLYKLVLSLRLLLLTLPVPLHLSFSSFLHSHCFKKIVVFGGNGYVGQSVVRAALKLGFDVTSIARSGEPRSGVDADMEGVTWAKGDLLGSDDTWTTHLVGAKVSAPTIKLFFFRH